MTLTVSCPADWKTVSNSLEKRYDDARSNDAKRVLDRHDISHFLKFYSSEDDVALYEFE